MDIRSIGKIEGAASEDGDKFPIGNRVRVKVVKNKIAPPFKTAEFDILYNQGISKEGDLLDLATKYEFVRKAGAFYSYGETKLGQGRESSKAYLTENPAITKELDAKIRERVATA
jgi:recombination protein RecA